MHPMRCVQCPYAAAVVVKVLMRESGPEHGRNLAACHSGRSRQNKSDKASPRSPGTFNSGVVMKLMSQKATKAVWREFWVTIGLGIGLSLPVSFAVLISL